jgi:hypothetical protein
MYQILEVGDEWNILKCILSIMLAILEEFLVGSLFHETKISIVNMKVQVYYNFRI